MSLGGGDATLRSGKSGRVEKTSDANARESAQ
jgi:hypothetical protein